MARPKQVIINDLMSELNNFGGHITNIQKAIEGKGVVSEGKLFKFADEINSIESASAYKFILEAVSRARNKGYAESELIELLDDLRNKNQPQHGGEYTPDPNFDAATATEIPAGQFKGRSDLEGELNCPDVIKVGAEAFTLCAYGIVKLPKATDINVDAFIGSEIKVLEIPSFIWKDDNLNLQDKFLNRYGLNKIVVADESIPPSDIANNKVDMEIYNHDSSKKWDVYTKMWKLV